MRIVRSLRVSQFQVNLASNFAGRIWGALMGLAFVPVYVRYLGIEAYGLVGVFAALQAIGQLLDFGLAPTLNRELARLSALPERRRESRDLVRTFEIAYWGLGGILTIAIWLLAPFLARQWIQAEGLPTSTVEEAVRLMALVLGLQWPLGIYYGGLMGLQRQARANVIRIVMSTAAAVGAVAVLARVSSQIGAFFAWQALMAGAHLALTAILLWRSLPSSDTPPRFSWLGLKGSWKFAAGMTGITVTAVIATQLDKVILSGLLSLEMFGYYALAAVVAGGLRIVAAPIFDALFPRFSALVALADEAALRELYHRSAQLMCSLTLSLTLVLFLFAHEALYVWTGSELTAVSSGPILALLALGTGINGLWVIPYALQLAAGWTGLAFGVNTALIVALVPALLWATPRFGAVGAAGAWALFNTGGLLVASLLTHRRILIGEWGAWARQDVLMPLLGAVLSALAFRAAFPPGGGRLGQAAWLVAAALGGVTSAVLLSNRLRSWAMAQLGSVWGRAQ